MIHSYWALKGGSGTTSTAAAMGLAWARNQDDPVLLVDLAGDIPAVLGIASTAPVGLSDYLAAGEDFQKESLKHLEYEIAEGVSLLTRGQKPLVELDNVMPSDASLREASFQVAPQAKGFLKYLEEDSRDIIVDCGNLWDLGLNVGAQIESHQPELIFRRAIAEGSGATFAFTRSCYLSLRRLSGFYLRPKGVGLMSEAGRALSALDVSEIVGAPIFLNVAYDVSVMRAVDMGLLETRLPRKLERLLGMLAPGNTADQSI